jgi:hypothetical protein
MTQANGRGSHAESKEANAIGMYTHAEGSETSAGFNDQTVGTIWGDQASHAEGYQTFAKAGSGQHAEGVYTICETGGGSHAEGYGTNAAGG